MPRLAPTERFAVWGQGYGAFGRNAGDGNAPVAVFQPLP